MKPELFATGYAGRLAERPAVVRLHRELHPQNVTNIVDAALRALPDKQFKEFQKRIMVSTDLFGRGIDIERVNIVINYDMPDESDSY